MAHKIKEYRFKTLTKVCLPAGKTLQTNVRSYIYAVLANANGMPFKQTEIILSIRPFARSSFPFAIRHSPLATNSNF